jgi:hypothetical protein
MKMMQCIKKILGHFVPSVKPFKLLYLNTVTVYMHNIKMDLREIGWVGMDWIEPVSG